MCKNIQAAREAFGFTLIELLIVVAIIAILALIAVPNFLEAQTRAKVSRVKTDHRTLATGLEAYCVDNSNYPPGREQNMPTPDRVVSLWRLTTPIAYVTDAALIDPFILHGAWGSHPDVNMYLYFCYAAYSPWAQRVHGDSAQYRKWGYHMGWALVSPGPDATLQAAEWVPVQMQTGAWDAALRKLYDPTNGTVSAGDIARYGGDVGVAAVLK